MIKDVIIFVLPFLIPYTVIGFEAGNILLPLVAILYIAIYVKKVALNRNIIIALVILFLLAVISLVSNFNFLALGGVNLYLSPILYYVIYCSLKEDKRKDDIMKYTVYIMAVVSFASVIYQGIYLNLRVFGLFGYANTFALSLLILIHINNVRKEDYYSTTIDIIFITSMFFTGSRNTFLWLAIYSVVIAVSKRQIKPIANILMGLMVYILISTISIAGLLLAPILIYIYEYIAKGTSKGYNKRKIIFTLVIIVAAFIVILVTGSSNSIERIRDISFINGSIQEGLIIFGDTIKAVEKVPFGHGINTFGKLQYYFQSAYYSIKYVHNSVIQIAFDIGVFAVVPFLYLIFYVVIKICQNFNDKNKVINVLNLSILLIIFFHSLLDFDFSFSSIFALYMLPFSVLLDINKEFYLRKRSIVSAIYGMFIFLSVLLYNEGSLKLGKYMINSSNYETGRSIISTVLLRDSRYYQLVSDSYREQYSEIHDPDMLKEMEDNLGAAIRYDGEDLNLKWNMAYVKGKHGKYEDAISIWNNIISVEKYNPKVYQTYYNYLTDLEENSSKSFTKQIERIKQKHDEAYLSLNPRSKYIKHQLKQSFNETLEMDVKD
ncbi:hypothetical protein CFOLD11_40490 [Clostridium folliculivorans]|uniref:O-antigen ligase-related domain-containing protein n=1 Tax=Clostridium folliculivorans TaxID=2886038 RepID=A0A9W5Y6C1_9CLOT|nr:O-antigen ligase family protein [Clostridium folliculivorans]GKU27222.1 hypothetical protein CFOLD11_40490 [Clostridium folliculivorans]